MKYLTEISEGEPCIVANCPWFNVKYEQNCQAEFNGEPHVASCIDYAPANIQQQGQVDSHKKEEKMANWGIASTAPEIEKIKAELTNYLQGLISCTEIDYSTYSQLFDVSLPLIQKAYDLGKKEAQQVIQSV